MSDVVEEVAKAITRAIDQSERVQLLSRDEMMQKAARAAIQAYEAAKREAAEPYVTRVEKGVTYWSNGLCSQSVPGSKEFAYAQILSRPNMQAPPPEAEEKTRQRMFELSKAIIRNEGIDVP